ncbi:hypothetical protein CR513_21519, partial [Mucuna pruriens]
MASSSFNMEDLSPKSKLMMEYMKKLKEKIEKLEGGLESMRIDCHSVNAKIRSWSKKQEKEAKKPKRVSSSSDDNDESCNSKSSRSHRSENVVKTHERTFNEPKKIEQNIDCINCEDLTKVKLIALSLEGYALIWWNEITLQIEGIRRASIRRVEERDEGKIYAFVL